MDRLIESKEITLKSKEYIIIFIDKSTRIIKEEVYKKIVDVSTMENIPDNVFVGGQYYNFKSISKILSLDEYYEQYPNRTAPKREEFEKVKDERPTKIEDIIKTSKKRFELTLKGLKKYCVEIPESLNAKHLLNKLFKEYQVKYNK